MLGLSKPERYRDVAKILSSCGVLSRGEANALELWIGLRNVLVHGYATIDYDKLSKALEEIEELEGIVERLYEYVSSRSIDPEPALPVLEKLRKILEERSEIVFAYLFGSYASGREATPSDVDVAVYSKRRIEWRGLVKLKHELEDERGSSRP